MKVLEVAGQPIGGEDAREHAWRDRIAMAAVGAGEHESVHLHFRMAEPDRVDLDNLVRPVLAGLRDADVFRRGYGNLRAVSAEKTSERLAGVVMSLGRSAAAPKPAFVTVTSAELPHAEQPATRSAWRARVAEAYSGPAISAHVYVDVAVSTPRSMEGLMKPIIDGLEPVLGRDPRGRLVHVPNDHLVRWLRFRRVPDGPRLTMRLGLLRARASAADTPRPS